MWQVRVKPIIHCDAKYLASGVGVGQCPRRQNFALEIPTCWYILALPNAKICVIPDAKPQHQPVEYSLHWVLAIGFRVGHLHFIFCVSISFVLGSVFPVEYGLKSWWRHSQNSSLSPTSYVTDKGTNGYSNDFIWK